MKRHPRIRKTIKWGGAAVTVLLATAWFGSGWFDVWRSPSYEKFVEIGHGRVLFGTAAWAGEFVTPPLPIDFPITEYDWQVFRMDWDIILPRGGRTWYAIPFWPLVLSALAITATAWRLDTLARRRARLNLCPNCNYSRTGLAPGAVCPECGTPAPGASA